MKTTLVLLILICGLAAAMQAQVAPSATIGAGTLHYSLRYAQRVETGGNLGTASTALASGDAGYANASQRLPFSADVSAGYNFSMGAGGENTGGFENLRLTQGFVWRSSSLLFSDTVGYRRQAPTTGFAGVAGTGETGVPPDQTNQTILTNNTSTVNNNATGEVEHRLNRSLSASAGGGYEMLAYPDGNGYDTDSVSANGGAGLRLNARNSVTARYVFMEYTYPQFTTTIQAQSVPIGVERRWTRQIHTMLSAGPQWISSSTTGATPAAGGATTPPPSSVSYSINAGLNDALRFGELNVTYSHGANGGGGFNLGAENDSLFANFNHELGTRERASVGVQAGYRRTAGLAKNGVTNAEYCTALANRRMGHDFSAFVSYALNYQTTSAVLTANALSGTSQIFSVGIEFSPRHVR
jgi:hypothetical protein